MVSLVAVTGGALVASLGIYNRLTNKDEVPQQGGTWKSMFGAKVSALFGRGPSDALPNTQTDPLVPMEIEPEIDLAAHNGLYASTVSLGVASTGLLFFPPLRYASVPLLLYMGIPAAQDTYDILLDRGRPSKAIAETIALAVCLASGFYWVGSLGFALYYLGQSVQQKDQWYNDNAKPHRCSLPRAVQLPSTTQLHRADGDITVAVSDLQIGDVIVLHSGEIAPTNGLIIEGMAWLKSPFLMGTTAETFKQAGDMVSATDIVLVGCIRIQVRSET